MNTANLLKRIEILEHTVGALEQLPGRVEALSTQIVQLRGEMRDEFSAVRTEMKEGFAAVRAELSEGLAAVRGEMSEGLAAVRAEMKAEDEKTRALLISLNQETRTHMLVLREDLAERIKWIGEGAPSARTVTTKKVRATKKPRR